MTLKEADKQVTRNSMSIFWKLSILSARQAVYALRAAFGRTDGRSQLADEENNVDKLQHVLTRIDQFNNMHPNYARHEYGDLAGYLRRHLSEEEWQLYYSTPRKRPVLQTTFTGQEY